MRNLLAKLFWDSCLQDPLKKINQKSALKNCQPWYRAKTAAPLTQTQDGKPCRIICSGGKPHHTESHPDAALALVEIARARAQEVNIVRAHSNKE